MFAEPFREPFQEPLTLSCGTFPLGARFPFFQATAKNAKMEEVREYMGVRKLSKGLQLRMRKHFDHVYRNTSVFRQVINEPPRLLIFFHVISKAAATFENNYFSVGRIAYFSQRCSSSWDFLLTEPRAGALEGEKVMSRRQTNCQRG